MRKKAVTILLTAVLALQGVSAPVCLAAAAGSTQASAERAQEEEPSEEPSESTQVAEPAENAQEAAASESAGEDAQESVLGQGTAIGEDLYKKVDEAIDGVDKQSLRRTVREALEQMDEMGISPTALAENVLGIRPTYGTKEKAPENTLIRDAKNAVQKKTEGFFTVLWNGFLDTLENMILSGLRIFSGGESSGAATGGSK